MGNEILKENFVGKYDGYAPSILLPSGWLSGGANVRKASVLGGWKTRKGCVLNNTTVAESGAAIKSLHLFKHPIKADRHFIAQVNSKLLKATNDPPAAGTTFGTDIGVTVGTTPGFSDVIGSAWVYADSSGKPIIYRGTSPYPIGLFSFADTGSVYSDYTTKILDGRSDTYFKILSGANDKLYVLTPEPCESLTFDLDTVQANSVTLTVKAWRSGAWAAVSGMSDGTTHFTEDGTISWTRSTSDDLKVIGNIMGYAYEISWSGALSTVVTGHEITCGMDATGITNKWNGIFEWVSGARFYDDGAGKYGEVLGSVTNESESQYVDISESTTSDFIYIKSVEPITGLGIGVASDYENTANAQIDLIEYWDGTDWADIATFDDTTLDSAGDSSFAQTGKIFWDATGLTPEKRVFEGDEIPGYWYRISWDATLSTDVRIYAMLYAASPESLPTYNGCIEFKGRLLLWDDTNRLRYSALDKVDCFSGTDSGWTKPFGGQDAIRSVVKFYNELLVFKKSEVYLLEGYSPNNFGILRLTSKTGIATPKSAINVEVGYPGMTQEEVSQIVLWQDVDGVYAIDGRKPKKVSGSINQYFNPESSECVAAADITSLQAFADRYNNEYHLLLGNAELVYNFLTDEWYPPWDREVNLTTGLLLEGTDGRFYTYGATEGGFVHRLENDTSDKNNSNADVAISWNIKTRAIASSGDSPTPSLSFTLKRLWILMKTQTSGNLVTKSYKNLALSGVSQSTPSAASMVESGVGLTSPHLLTKLSKCACVEFEFGTATIDIEGELWGAMLEIESIRPL